MHRTNIYGRMNKQLLLLAAALLSGAAMAQDLHIKVNEKGRVGYADGQGQEVIPCKYDFGFPFEDGVAQVGKGEKYGYVDAQGNVVVKLSYDQITPWRGDIVCVKKGKKYGLVNCKTGESVLPAAYAYVSKPNCYGRALIIKGGKPTQDKAAKRSYILAGKMGIVSDEGRVLIEAKNTVIQEFAEEQTANPVHEGLLLTNTPYYIGDTLRTDCRYIGVAKKYNYKTREDFGLMDGEGNLLIKMGAYTLLCEPQGGMVRYYDQSKKGTKYGYYNLETKTAFECGSDPNVIANISYWTHGDFIGSTAPVNSSEGWRIITKENTVVRSGYSNLSHSRMEGLWTGKKSDTACDVFDEEGKDVFKGQYEYVWYAQEESDKGILVVQKDGKRGVMDREEKMLVPCTYASAGLPQFGTLSVSDDNGKWGKIDYRTQDVLVPLEYVNVGKTAETNPTALWAQVADSTWHLYHVTARRLGTTAYTNIANFKGDLTWACPKDYAERIINEAGAADPENPVKGSLYDADQKRYAKQGIDIGTDYGIIINKDEEVVFSAPVYWRDADAAYRVVRANQGKALTPAQSKRYMLYMTRDYRRYPLTEVIPDAGWDY